MVLCGMRMRVQCCVHVVQGASAVRQSLWKAQTRAVAVRPPMHTDSWRWCAP